MDLLTLVLLALATARITRLVTLDSIADPARHAILTRAYSHSDARGDFVDELLSCPWCAGFWVSLAAAWALMVLDPSWVRWLSLPWALSYLTGALANTVE